MRRRRVFSELARLPNKIFFLSNLLEFSRISSETRSGVEGGNSGDDGRRMWQKYSTAEDFQIFGRIQVIF